MLKRMVVMSVVVAVLLTSTAFAAINRAPNAITNDIGISQQLKEIKVTRQKLGNFDNDIKKLDRIKKRYKERLPLRYTKNDKKKKRKKYRRSSRRSRSRSRS